MVLDIDQFRPEKGGNPDKIRENQKLRFSDVSMVDKIVQADENWRKGKWLFVVWMGLKTLRIVLNEMKPSFKP